MESKNKAKPLNQISFSARNNHYQSMDQNLENNIDQKEFSIKNYNNYSVLKQNFLDTQLKNISINFGFPNTLNSYDYQNSFDLLENPVFEQRNYFYYDKNFKLFKNKSVSKYGDKKFNQKKFLNPKLNKNRVLSPQHKIITSLKKKKCNEEQNKNINKENDIYELEVINKVLYDEDDSEEKNKKTIKETISSKPEEELGSEWGEIEQAIYEEKKDPNNNLLNSVCVEIEKENGDRQLKYVEISKDENCLDDPCLNIKYTIEDKICLNCTTPSKNKNIKKQKYSTLIKNKNKNEKNILPKNLINSSWKKENVSEIHLKESKSTQNIISSSDTTEKVFFSGSTVPSSQKYSKYSHAMNNLSDLSNKEKNKTIDEIKSLNYRFKSEFKNSEITDINNINNKNSNLTEKIIGKKQKEEKDNLSPNKITNLKYNRSSYDNTSHKKTNNFLENKENINVYEQKRDISTKKETQEKKIYNITKIEEKSEKENEEDKQRIIKRTFIRHKNEEEENNLIKEKLIKKDKEKDKDRKSSANKSQEASNLGKYEMKNGDRIRLMSNEELADFIFDTAGRACECCSCEQYDENTWPKGFLYMHFCQDNAPMFAKTGVVLSYMHMNEVRRWMDTQVGKRGQDYEDFKNRKAELLLNSLESHFPGIRHAIKNIYTSTPLTYQDYTGTQDGSMYGIAKDVSLGAAGRVPHKTKIPNVYQTGQNINSHGMLGVLVGTIVTCSELLSAKTIYQQIVEAGS